MQAFGRNQFSVQVSGFGCQDLGFADTWYLKPVEDPVLSEAKAGKPYSQ